MLQKRPKIVKRFALETVDNFVSFYFKRKDLPLELILIELNLNKKDQFEFNLICIQKLVPGKALN